MPGSFIYFRLHLRNKADDADIIVLSSKKTDTNALLCEAPDGDGQKVDPIMGTLQVGTYTWTAIDRYDGGDTFTITAIIADANARNQILSNKCIAYYSTDTDPTWIEFHTGFLNDIKLGDAKTFVIIVGDTDRRERDAKLFTRITETFDQVSNLVGGPVVADPEVAWGGTPARSWGPLVDYGPGRFTVIGNSSGGSPNPAHLVNQNRVTLSLVSANLPPLYLGQQGSWSVPLPGGLKWSYAAEYIDKMARQYFEWDADKAFETTSAETSQPFGSFPQLEVKMRRVSDNVIFQTYPIAQATKKASTVIPGLYAAIGDYSALVANSNDWLIVYWDTATMGAQPSLGATFDVWVRPITISKDNPLHLSGHPVDIHRMANVDQGIPDDTTSAEATKDELGDLWYELWITEEWEYSKFTEMLKSSAGYAVRYSDVGAVQEFFPTRSEQPDEVDIVEAADIVGDAKGKPKEIIFKVSEGSAIKGVDFKLKSFRLWSPKTDSESERPIDGIIAKDLTINGHRRDESVYGSRIVVFAVPGMIMLSGGAVILNQPLALRDWIIRAGEVIIDRAGWGWAEGEVEVFNSILGKIGEYLDLRAPHQVNSKIGQDPITQRGGTRKVQIVGETKLIGSRKLSVKDAGNLAQDPPDAGDGGTLITPCTGMPEPDLSLSPSVDNPTTVAVVTLNNVADFMEVNADTELQYLVQEATPAPTDDGAAFGPLPSSTGADTIDAPAVTAGQLLWVRGRLNIPSIGQVCAWSDWISLRLGPTENGVPPDQSPTLSLAFAIDVDGNVTVTATTTGTSVKFALADEGDTEAPDADVRAATADSSAPFEAVDIVTLDRGDERFVSAFAYDDLNNESLKVTIRVFRDESSGGGTGSGRPGDFSLTLIAGGPHVFRNIGTDLLEFKALKRARKYCNTLFTPKARLQVNNWVAASGGTQLHWVFSRNNWVTYSETGVYVRLDRVNFPEPGEYLDLDPDAISDNVQFGLALKGGDGTTVAKFSDVFLDAVSVAEPPESPAGDPGDLPIGPPYGEIIDDRNALLLGAVYADGASVTNWADDSARSNPDAMPDGLAGQGAPTYRATGFNGAPCVEFDASNDGLKIASGITNTSFTHYHVVKGIGDPASPGISQLWNAPENDHGYGLTLLNPAIIIEGGIGKALGAYVNDAFISPTFINIADSWGRTGSHIYRFAFDRGSGQFKVHVDGVLKISGTCSPTFLEADRCYIGFLNTLAAAGFLLGRSVMYDQAWFTNGMNDVELALKAVWSTT